MKEDKRRAILDAAMGVFSRKGYHAASIQEIAEEAGVAKGSVYLYFKSKDELALFALQHACEQIAQRVKEAALERGLPARERFVRQLTVQLRESASNAEFLIRLWSEQAISIGEELKTFMTRMRIDETEWLRQSILTLYGEEAAPYAYDAAFMLQGAVASFMGYQLFGGPSIPPDRLAGYLLVRLDDLVAGLMRDGDAPMVEERDILAMIRSVAPQEETRLAWSEELNRLRRDVAAAPRDAATAELEEALDALDLEAAKREPRRIVVQSVLRYMRDAAPERFRPAIDRLEKLAP